MFDIVLRNVGSNFDINLSITTEPTVIFTSPFPCFLRVY